MSPLKKSLLALAALPFLLGGCGALGLSSTAEPGASAAPTGPVSGDSWAISTDGSPTPSPAATGRGGADPGTVLPSPSFLPAASGCDDSWRLNPVLIPITVTPGAGSLTVTWARQYESDYRVAAVPQNLKNGSQPDVVWQNVPATDNCTVTATVRGLTAGKPYIVWLDAPNSGHEIDGTRHPYSGRSEVVYPK